MPAQTIRIAIVGASGYTGDELIRACLRHPHIRLVKLTSRQLKGTPLGKQIPCTGPVASLKFEDLSPSQVAEGIDVAFLCLPHGVASEYALPLLAQGLTVIDLSADFRLKNPADYVEFYHAAHPAPQTLASSVYALPEFHREEIAKGQLLACPGCYPTSVQLALVPGLKAGHFSTETIIINSLSGVSGAGKKADLSLLYAECNENLRAYGLPAHRHLPEIEQELSLAAGKKITVSFTPHLVPLTRGMLTTISITPKTQDFAKILETYQKAYEGSPFVRVLTDGDLPQTKRVSNTNNAEIALVLDKRTGRITILSAIDNLGKGAATQAIQAFNIRYGFPETDGLMT